MELMQGYLSASVLSGEFQQLEVLFGVDRRRHHSELGHDAASDQLGRGHVKGRVPALDSYKRK